MARLPISGPVGTARSAALLIHTRSVYTMCVDAERTTRSRTFRDRAARSAVFRRVARSYAVGRTATSGGYTGALRGRKRFQLVFPSGPCQVSEGRLDRAGGFGGSR